MALIGRNRGASTRFGFSLALSALAVAACAPSDPLLAFLDEETGVSFTHPPRWNVGFAEQSGMRYRYVTAPKVPGDAEALSVTLIAPSAADSVDAAAGPYLTGATEVVTSSASDGAKNWTFRDSSGVSSKLRLKQGRPGFFFGAWVRGSGTAMERYASRIETLLGSIRVEDPAHWPEERFAGMIGRAPSAWTRGSRLSSPTLATMQFKSLPLSVDKGTDTIHGFITLSKEPVPPPGDLEAYNKAVKTRVSDTVAVLEHKPWPSAPGLDRAEGLVDYMRSGNAMTSTRIRRWITVKNGVGLMLSCEARADAYDRLDPWCRRMAGTVRLD
jgi:hypothetical protein